VPKTRKTDECSSPGEACWVVIENVRPEVDAGRFPIKRVVGESVLVRADVFADEHDALVVILLYRPESRAE